MTVRAKHVEFIGMAFTGRIGRHDVRVEDDDVFVLDHASGLWTRCHGIREEDLADLRAADHGQTVIQRHPLLEEECRKVLARLRTGTVLAWSIPAPALRALEARGLVCEEFDHHVAATTSAWGYCSDPATFDLVGSLTLRPARAP